MESIQSDPPPPPSPPLLRQAQIPIPCATSGGSFSENNADFTSVPIHIITEPAQLPIEFLEPSPQKQLVIGLDCEGVDLCRNGTLCIMQLAFADAIYLVDVIEGGVTVMEACKPALESSYVTKVIHDCKRDSEALYFQFGIKLNNVLDTQIAYSTIEEQEGKKRLPDDYISFVGLLADPRYCGMSYPEKEEVRVLLRQDPSFWTHRPLSEMMIRTATDDVRFLLYIYQKMIDKLTDLSLWRVFIRGALYCHCFCLNNNNFADWPPLPPIPDGLTGEDSVPQGEILSVLDVPPGKMGRVIGRKGASIMSVKQSCNAEIHMGGTKGPPDRVFIIGPVKEVRKAEALLRGKMMDI
ncbi:hypothetical protein LUZ61_005651 [Rhynchospora tenuis]|uniref:3'-5' exonuclease n=1 Tax=Rhynchospora tenuis TaxID=198213 RepID=A0AAD5ZQ69_9POAL|nr:hypothetical protein LUZ61_005651 [Rhynchospora tenuis]